MKLDISGSRILTFPGAVMLSPIAIVTFFTLFWAGKGCFIVFHVQSKIFKVTSSKYFVSFFKMPIFMQKNIWGEVPAGLGNNETHV